MSIRLVPDSCEFGSLDFRIEEFDYGSMLGAAALIDSPEGERLLANMVTVPLWRETRPEAREPDRKVYVAHWEHIPVLVVEGAEEPVRPEYDIDEGGLYWIQPGQVIQAAGGRRLTRAEAKELVAPKISAWLDAVRRAGKVIEVLAGRDVLRKVQEINRERQEDEPR